MKFINSPFAIIDKRMNALDYQKKEFYILGLLRRERDYQYKTNKSI